MIVTVPEFNERIHLFINQWMTVNEITKYLDLYTINDIQTLIQQDVISDELHMDLLDYILNRIYGNYTDQTTN